MEKSAAYLLATLAVGALWVIADRARAAHAELYEIRLNTLDLKNAAWALANK